MLTAARQRYVSKMRQQVDKQAKDKEREAMIKAKYGGQGDGVDVKVVPYCVREASSLAAAGSLGGNLQQSKSRAGWKLLG